LALLRFRIIQFCAKLRNFFLILPVEFSGFPEVPRTGRDFRLQIRHAHDGILLLLGQSYICLLELFRFLRGGTHLIKLALIRSCIGELGPKLDKLRFLLPIFLGDRCGALFAGRDLILQLRYQLRRILLFFGVSSLVRLEIPYPLQCFT